MDQYYQGVMYPRPSLSIVTEEKQPEAMAESTYRNIVGRVAHSLDQKHHSPLGKLFNKIVENKRQQYPELFPASFFTHSQTLAPIHNQIDLAIIPDANGEEVKKDNPQVSTIKALVALRHATDSHIIAQDAGPIRRVNQIYPQRARLMENVARPVEMPQQMFRHYVWNTIRFAEYRTFQRQLSYEEFMKMGKQESLEFLRKIFGRKEMDKMFKSEFVRLWDRELRYKGLQTGPEYNAEDNYIDPSKLTKTPVIPIVPVVPVVPAATLGPVTIGQARQVHKRPMPVEGRFGGRKKVKIVASSTNHSPAEVIGYPLPAKSAPVVAYQSLSAAVSGDSTQAYPMSQTIAASSHGNPNNHTTRSASRTTAVESSQPRRIRPVSRVSSQDSDSLIAQERPSEIGGIMSRYSGSQRAKPMHRAIQNLRDESH